MRRVLLLLASVVMWTLAPLPAKSHEMSMAEMQVREIAPGDFIWQWTASGSTPVAQVLRPVWPKPCVAEENLLRCGTEGLKGDLGVEGIGEGYSAAVVHMHWLDGGSRVVTLTERQTSVAVYGSAEDRRGAGEIALAYLVLGVEHILTGLDHLLFVLGLLFLVGFRRHLVWTITAFTLAHSLTLAASALGWFTLRPPPVEATIALSIVLVATEALRREQTLARRWPAAVAFLFGLMHGLGFAGALSEIGLPAHQIPVALLTFNLGVELGQLSVVALALLAYRLLRERESFVALRTPALYAIGSLAAFWTLQRLVAIVV